MEIALIYLLTFLFPINGLILMGMIQERKKNRHLVMALWKITGRIK